MKYETEIWYSEVSYDADSVYATEMRINCQKLDFGEDQVPGFCGRPDLTEYCLISSLIIICMWSVYSISLKPGVDRKELKH